MKHSFLKRRSSLFRLTITFLNLAVIGSALQIFFIFLYVLAGIKPYIHIGKMSTVGLVDLANGIPVEVRMSTGYIPDSSFFSSGSGGGSSAYGSGSSIIKAGLPGGNRDSIRSAPDTRRDTIVSEFNIVHGVHTIKNKKEQPAYIKEELLRSGTLYIQTERRGWRLLLLLPMILSLSLIAFGAWQTSRLLKDILNGAAFNNINYRRIRNIGWGVIAYQLILFTLYLAFSSWWVFINFVSTIPGFQSPVPLAAVFQDDFSFSWLIGGYILLILAYAFKKGNQLQEEQDLTV